MSSSSPQTLPSAAFALFPRALLQHSKKQRVIQKKSSWSSPWEERREVKENFTFHATFFAGQTSLLGMLALCRDVLAWPSIHHLHEGPCFPVQSSCVGSAALGTSWHIAEDLRVSFSLLSTHLHSEYYQALLPISFPFMLIDSGGNINHRTGNFHIDDIARSQLLLFLFTLKAQ